MYYKSKVTSKGTITIPSQLRRSLGIRQGQNINLYIKNGQIVIDRGTDFGDFSKLRTIITKNIPPHLKGLSGDDLRKKSAIAWTKND